MWSLVIPAIASLAGGALAGAGAREAADEQSDAAREAVQLQREVYNDQRNINRPGYMTGGAATNILANQYGITPQNYDAAYTHQAPPSYSGGTQTNGLLNGLLNKGGSGGNWGEYLNLNPDVMGDWNAHQQIQQRFKTPEAFAEYHYNTFGKNEGRQLPGANGMGGGSAAPAPAMGTNGLTADPMAGFMASPDGRIAVSGFRGVDVPEINSAFARGGKVLSGAQSIALDDRGKARLGAAYGNYTNGLRSLAGQNQTATSNVTGAGGAFAANAGSATMAGGEARANGLTGAYRGLGNGVAGALDEVNSFGKKNWGWA